MEAQKIIHLYNRFGFGLNANQIKKYSKLSFQQKLNREKTELINLNFSEFKGFDFRNLSQKDKKKLRQSLRKKVVELNITWLKQMISSENIVHEKMNLFWHHHFACIIKNPLYGQQFSNIIRKNATGNFRDLVLGISKSAAMIDFLHTKQNRKQQPNEDFARELCELFTLGRDNDYTEKDVQEIARCFTGWKHRFDGSFIINENQHDFGAKTIFGNTGKYNGEDVIDLILKKKTCAKFICENVYTYFVNPKLNSTHIEELTNVFYNSNYNIETLIVHIAESDWFYNDENVLAKIKSPIELIVGLAKQFKIDNENPKSWLLVQRMFDQILYKPPNVAGWKIDKQWIDSNSLPLRLRLPSVILTNAVLEIQPKPDYDSNPNDQVKQNRFSKKLGFSYDWNYFFNQNQTIDFKELFFNGKISPQVANFLKNRTFDSKEEEVIQLISLPEYQLI